MFEYEYLLEDIRKYNKQQEEQRKEDEKKYNMPNVNSMMSQAQASMPKISIPKF
jgi:hypothetical protein